VRAALDTTHMAHRGGIPTLPRVRTGIRLDGNALNLPEPLWDSPFLRATRGEAVPHTPIWLMRQAGRYMQHYRNLRAGRGFLDLCRDPATAAEITCYARDWLGVDAAIIFSDILVLLEALDLPVQFTAGDGPVLPKPLRSARNVDALGDPLQAAADLGYVYDAIRLTVVGQPRHIPVIGFCGGPFTLAAYAIEGGSSRQFALTRKFMYREPEAWHRLCSILVTAAAAYLNKQIAAGASAVQVFESWLGHLPEPEARLYVMPHLKQLIGQIAPGVPVIAFAAAAGHLLEMLRDCGADVVGVDHCTPLADARRRLGATTAVQGNLDPALLLSDLDRVRAGADAVLAAAGGPGHIFNLGHGILKESDPELARALVAHVHGKR
jgi:uroporphyrinogen decarboxylase